MKNLLLFLLLCSMLTFETWAQDVDKIKNSALNGSIEHQVKMGDSFYLSDIVQRDYRKALEWYVKAAEQGFAPVFIRLGNIYLSGLGIDRDFTKAYAWCSIAEDELTTISDLDKKSCLKEAISQLDTEQLKEAKELSEEYKGLYVKPFRE